MRVTEVSKREQVLENIQKTSARLQDAQIQMATGQRINKPSDDPIGTAKMQDIVSTMSAQEQHLRNITDNIASLQHDHQSKRGANAINIGQLLKLRSQLYLL